MEMPGPSLSSGEQKNEKVLLPPKRGTRVGTCPVLKNHLTSREFFADLSLWDLWVDCYQNCCQWIWERFWPNPQGEKLIPRGWFTVLPCFFFVFFKLKFDGFVGWIHEKVPVFFTCVPLILSGFDWMLDVMGNVHSLVHGCCHLLPNKSCFFREKSLKKNPWGVGLVPEKVCPPKVDLLREQKSIKTVLRERFCFV